MGAVAEGGVVERTREEFGAPPPEPVEHGRPRDIKQAHVDEMCRLIAEDHVSLKKAAALAKVNYDTLLKWVNPREGNPPRRQKWADAIELAKATACQFWTLAVKRVGQGGEEAKGGNPVVKAAELMLAALDPDSFRKEQQRDQDRINVIVQVGKGEEPTTVRVTGVTVTDGPGQLPPGMQQVGDG